MECSHCGKTITNRDAHRFCDRACYLAYRRDHPEEFGKKEGEYTCAYCGKEGIRRKPSQLRNAVYCSRECSNRAQSEALALHPELRDPGIRLTCQYCGQPFYAKPYRADKAKYCSMACSHAYRFNKPFVKNSQDMRGTNNPNFRDARNRVTARLNGLGHFGKKCMVCGFDAVVQVHHITPYREGGKNTVDNVIVLCPNHHAMADLNLITREELFTLNRAAIAQLSANQLQFRLPEDELLPIADTSP